MELRYCILHEAMVETECEPICGHIEFIVPTYGEEAMDSVWDIDFCEFPLGYAFAPMPEAPDIELIAAFDRPYLEDLMEYQERVEQAVGELLFELRLMNV